SKLQACDVGSGDQKHTKNRAQQHPQCQPRPGSGHLKAQRYHANAAVRVGRRRLLVETACDRAHLGLRLLESHVRLKSPNDGPETSASRTANGFPIRKHGVRFPHIRIIVKLETCREDTDDPGSVSVKLDGRAYRIEGASEAALPEAMTDQGHALPLLGLLGREDAPVQGLNAEQWEQVGSVPDDTDLFRPVCTRQRRRNTVKKSHIREALAL